MSTKDKDILIDVSLEYDPSIVHIGIAQSELRDRLKKGETFMEILEDVMWDGDYSDWESDGYYRTLTVDRVKLDPGQ